MLPDRRAPPAALELFARACLDARLLRVVYRAARGEVTEREVGVIALTFRGGVWIAAVVTQPGRNPRARGFARRSLACPAAEKRTRDDSR